MFHHKHPLSLVDLQIDDLTYLDEEEDDVKKEIEAKQEFRCRCNRCGEEINWFHRYYYNCKECSSGYSIHKFCAEVPTTLEHHPFDIAHTLILLLQREDTWWCRICRTDHEPEELGYRCYSSGCRVEIDVNCAVKWLKTNIIHHPSHVHPLVPINRRIICECDACGKEHKGIFYECTCATFLINSDCAFLPKKLKIQDVYTDGFFSHTHPLTLAYSFPYDDQNANHFPRCRVCDKHFYKNEYLWIYKCDDCRYYTHLDCATARGKPTGLGKSIKNFDDVDYPNLLHFPLPDQTESLLKEIFFKQMASSPTPSICSSNILQHRSHPHPLILVDHHDTKSNDHLLLHNPMKKIELLCNGCLRPITDMPFYKCTTTTTTTANQECHDFVLHEWCTRLPDRVLDHPAHPQHPLLLLPNASHHHKLLGVFRCGVCKLHCNGFVYSCVECDYHIDVNCAFIPDNIAHEAHPNHLLCRVQSTSDDKRCRSCIQSIWSNRFSYSCPSCELHLHLECALFLPQTIRHRFDKHPMKLSYFPIENHKSQYFCDVCEEELDPQRWFYHCYDCVQSIHAACSPVIVDCRRAGPYEAWSPRRIHDFLNIKFRGIHNIEDHSHPVSFDQGIESDGDCDRCWVSLWYKMIFKCLECKYVIHFNCCKSLKGW